jgi:hypothetical protein
MSKTYVWDKAQQAWVEKVSKSDADYNADWTATMKRAQTEKEKK